MSGCVSFSEIEARFGGQSYSVKEKHSRAVALNTVQTGLKIAFVNLYLDIALNMVGKLPNPLYYTSIPQFAGFINVII